MGNHTPPSSIQNQKDTPSAIQKHRKKVLSGINQESLWERNAKRDTAINPRTCNFCLYVLAMNAKDSYGTQKIHTDRKRFIWDATKIKWDAKESYGTQQIPTERKRFLWDDKESYRAQETAKCEARYGTDSCIFFFSRRKRK